MLLNLVKGPISFEDVRSINGKIYAYREACYAWGMLNEDTEWTDAIQEARLWASGKQLRELATQPSFGMTIGKVYLKTSYSQKERTLDSGAQAIQRYFLLHIEEELSQHGKTISKYPGLPVPDQTLITPIDNRLIREELSYSKIALIIYHKVVAAITQKCGGFFFVYGAGGTGKTSYTKQ
ncbi:hypothetical protein V2J09_006357 [Rumex salicifolius]